MTVEQSVPERTLIEQLSLTIGSEKPDLKSLGYLLLELSREVLTDAADLKPLESLKASWEDLAASGFDSAKPLPQDLTYFLADVNSISNLREPLDSHNFYLPWGSGTVRLLFRIDLDGKLQITLADDGQMPKVRENFARLIGESNNTIV